jgi:hypothetical protein
VKSQRDRGADKGAGMGATLEVSSYKKSKSLVRRDELEKGKSISSKTTCRETIDAIC